jgi:hypothetical protein
VLAGNAKKVRKWLVQLMQANVDGACWIDGYTGCQKDVPFEIAPAWVGRYGGAEVAIGIAIGIGIEHSDRDTDCDTDTEYFGTLFWKLL